MLSYALIKNHSHIFLMVNSIFDTYYKNVMYPVLSQFQNLYSALGGVGNNGIEILDYCMKNTQNRVQSTEYFYRRCMVKTL